MFLIKIMIIQTLLVIRPLEGVSATQLIVFARIIMSLNKLVTNRANKIIQYLHNIVSSIQWFNLTDASWTR